MPIVVADDDGVYTDANEAAAGLLGLSREELIGRRIADFDAMPRENAEHWKRFLRGDSPSGEFTLRRADGAEVAVEYSAVPNIAPGVHVSILRDITRRRRLEREREESERRYRELAANANDIIYTMDLEGTFLSVSGAVTPLLGYTEDEIVGADVRSLLSDQAREQVEQSLEQRRSGDREPYRYELEVVTREGSPRWLEIVSRFVESSDGQMVIHGVARDIQDRRIAEAAIRESEERFRTVVETLPGGVWLSDGTRPLMANSGMVDLSGYAMEEILTPGFLGRFVRADYADVVRQRGDARMRGESAPSPYRVPAIRKDGTELWIELHGSRTTYREQPVNLVVAFDVTEQELAQQRLEESARQLREMLSGLPVSVWITDGAEVIYANPAAAELTGHTLEQLMSPGYMYGKAIHPDDRDRMWEMGAARVRGERVPSTYEVRIVRADGTVVPAEIHASLITLRGNPASLVVAVDLSERQRAEEERRMIETRLQHAQKLESLGLLAGGIAHDFNNLLVGMLGNADLALSQLSPESPARETVGDVMVAAQRAADLTRQMLAYSGKGRFVIQSLSLERVVEEVAHLLDSSISRKATLRFDFAPQLPDVEADAAQLQQVVMNLIINASDALEDERGVITVSTGVTHCDTAYLTETYLDDELPEGDYVHLEVSDTGKGMDRETRERIFDPFYTTKFTGRGLGLAAVLGIVRGHRGAIKVYSERGRGSTFKVLLPPAPAPRQERTETTGTAAAAWSGMGTVLLVDDDATVRGVAGRMLQNMGFDVIAVASGEEAVTLFAERAASITLAIVDLTMPGLDGGEVFQQFRRIRPDVRVILTSGYNEQEATSALLGKGLAGFIQKPFRYADLVEKVRSVMEAERGTQPGT